MFCVLNSFTFMFCIDVNYILALFYIFILDYKFNNIILYQCKVNIIYSIVSYFRLVLFYNFILDYKFNKIEIHISLR